MSQTLAIADSSALFRLGVRNMSRQIEGIEVVGEASCGEDLIGLVESFEPSVVVVDFLSSGFDIDIVRKVKASKPKTRILAITTQQSGHTLVNALRAGVDSYIKKDCDLGEVQDAICETANGGTFSVVRFWTRFARNQSTLRTLSICPCHAIPSV